MYKDVLGSNITFGAVILIIIILGTTLISPYINLTDNFSSKREFYPIEIAFSSNGDKLAIFTQNWEIEIFDVTTGKLVQKINPVVKYDINMQWSPQGNLLAISGINYYDDGAMILQIYDFKIQSWVVSHKFTEPVDTYHSYNKRTLQWSNDQKYLLLQKESVLNKIEPSEKFYNHSFVIFQTSSWNIIQTSFINTSSNRPTILPNSDLSLVVIPKFDWKGNSSVWDIKLEKVRYEIIGRKVLKWKNESVLLLGTRSYYTNMSFIYTNFSGKNVTEVKINGSFPFSNLIVSFDGKYATSPLSWEFNTIWNIPQASMVYTFQQIGQDWPSFACTPKKCPISLLYFWSDYSNILAHTLFFRGNNTYQLKIFDVNKTQYISTIN